MNLWKLEFQKESLNNRKLMKGKRGERRISIFFLIIERETGILLVMLLLGPFLLTCSVASQLFTVSKVLYLLHNVPVTSDEDFLENTFLYIGFLKKFIGGVK